MVFFNPLTPLKRKLRLLDSFIRQGLDRILPRNLTIRYVSALSAVGVLAVLGQVLIQISLAKQMQDQRRIAFLQQQIYNSESLRKIGIDLQRASKKNEVTRQVALMEPLCEQMSKIDGMLWVGDTKVLEFETPPEFIPVQQNTLLSLATLLTECRRILSLMHSNPLQPVSEADSPLEVLASELIQSERTYQKSLQELLDYYEKRLKQQIASFKNTELILLLATLILLILEGLYVFRPAVERLYFALQTHSDFLGHMGHEIRNPMNSILGMTHLLVETPLTPQQKKYLSILKKSSRSLLDMLNNLLDFSSLAAGSTTIEKVPFHLYELLERSIDLAVFGAHANGIELILNLGTDVPFHLVGDPVRIQQVLLNLLGNAVKFTQRGAVTLQVSLVKKDPQCVIEFAIIDTGIGIEKGKTEKIFNPFVQEDSTVRRRFGGSGLGLSISKELVKAMSGTLGVETQKNVGSKFFFTIPFERAHGPQDKQSFSHLNEILSTERFGPYEAVIIEPNDQIFDLIQSTIQKTGGHCVRLEKEEELPPFFSDKDMMGLKKEAVIIDFEYARNTLNTLFSRYRREKLELSHFVFLIKTTASAEDIEKLAEYGIKNFLFKPVKPIPLIDSIRQACLGMTFDSSKEMEKAKAQTQEIPQDERRLKILIVDDSKDNQFLMKAYLGATPYKLEYADNGKAAVDLFQEVRFDLVLMDLQMPEMDGYTASRLIRAWESQENLPSTPIVAVSAHDHEYQSEQFIHAQFAAYLVKPISPSGLRKTILQVTQPLELASSCESSPVESSVHSPQPIQPPLSEPQPSSSSLVLQRIQDELAELVPQYLINRHEELKDLKQFIETQEFQRIETIGHRLKGNAKSYGFEALGRLGGALEFAAQKKDLLAVEQVAHQMKLFLDEVGEKRFSSKRPPICDSQDSVSLT
ncbi:MAG: response regulator [Bdellovibrionia bacterium]